MDSKRHLIRVNGRLKEVVTVLDNSGKEVHKFLQPFMVEFYPRDVMQVVVGATILAVPVAFTEETWIVSSQMSVANTLAFLGISWFFMGSFIFYNFYREHFKQHWTEFMKRTLTTYFVSFAVVTLILFLIGKAPWGTDAWLAFKRTVLVAFPASMSAAVSDVIK